MLMHLFQFSSPCCFVYKQRGMAGHIQEQHNKARLCTGQRQVLFTAPCSQWLTPVGCAILSFSMTSDIISCRVPFGNLEIHELGKSIVRRAEYWQDCEPRSVVIDGLMPIWHPGAKSPRGCNQGLIHAEFIHQNRSAGDAGLVEVSDKTAGRALEGAGETQRLAEVRQSHG